MSGSRDVGLRGDALHGHGLQLEPAEIAVVDDEERVREVLALLLRRSGYVVHMFAGGAEFVTALEDRHFDLVLTDLRMPSVGGMEVVRACAVLEIPTIVITAHGSISNAIEAIREGAFDYIEKPFDNERCRQSVARALQASRLLRENRTLRTALQAQFGLDGLIAVSPGMQAVVSLARRAARSKSTVLVRGASGTGKERIAQAIHFYSDRVGGPFEAVNCKALAPGVLESELFGHERGAFTGAQSARKGLFERAEGGTVLLDEIGEMDVGLQAKLLRVLQERVVTRVGGNVAIAFDTRIIAATHRDLEAAVADGSFREDLYYRIAVIPVMIPPLSERSEDVVPLAKHFAARIGRGLGREIDGFTAGALATLQSHDWPGNVRELENCVERAVVLGDGPMIDSADLMLRVDQDGGLSDGNSLRAAVDRASEAHIRKILATVGGARGEAARQLGVDRTTLYRLCQRLGIDAA